MMGEGDWRAQLDELYALGVRTLQPVHQLDNRFGGAAPHNTIFHIAQYAENCHIDRTAPSPAPPSPSASTSTDCKNVLGLTDEGRRWSPR
jgi:microsomal dipeptidase-like Zn-dependent dipeptidase